MKSLTYWVGSTEENLLLSRFGDLVQCSHISYDKYVDGDPSHSTEAYECYLFGEPEPVSKSYHYGRYGKATKKIPMIFKNIHRGAWGLPLLKEEKICPEWYLDWNNGSPFCPTPENVGEIPAPIEEWMLANNGKRCYWYGNKEMFKTWAVATPTSQVLTDLVPLCEGTDFIVKVKVW